ncbi:MAG: cytochrome-c peroxidase [Bacteroidia bacterium]
MPFLYLGHAFSLLNSFSMKKWPFTILLLLTIIACQETIVLDPDRHFELMEAPEGFPDMPVPDNNTFSQARWDLGKKLFFDPVMSVDSSISCASCHKPSLAFSDNLRFSPGVENRPGVRNSPSLANVGYHPYFTREGGVPTLEMQVFVPIQEHNEFAFNMVLLARRLEADSTYVRMAREAYNREPDAFVITRSLACFERSLISGYSPYDQYVSYDNTKALSKAQQRGMDLFFSDKTNCSSCHGGFNFTNYEFENNGLYDEYADVGRLRLTGDEADRALFKVPSLRNIALTAPYMHDGSMNSLSRIVAHYVSGGADNPQKNPLIRPLTLTGQEQDDLVEFLTSLTDETFVQNPLFSN